MFSPCLYPGRIGRVPCLWPSRDPIGERGGVSLYVCCRNQLLGFWDRLGLVVGHGEFIEIGGVTDAKFKELYLRKGRTEDDSLGATFAAFLYQVDCVKCGTPRCRRLVLVKDTHLFGITFWRAWAAGQPTRGGRTTVEHERQHVQNAKVAAGGFNRELRGLLDGACVTGPCCNKKRAYIRAVSSYWEAMQGYDDASLDVEDWPLKDLDEAYRNWDEAREKVSMAQGEITVAEAAMITECNGSK